MGSANSKLFGSTRDRSKGRHKLKKKKAEKQSVADSGRVSSAVESSAMISPASPQPESQCDLRQPGGSPSSEIGLPTAKSKRVTRQDLGEHRGTAGDAPMIQHHTSSYNGRKTAAQSINSPSYQSSNAVCLKERNPAPDTVTRSLLCLSSTTAPEQTGVSMQTQHSLASVTNHTPMGNFSYATAGSTRLEAHTNEHNPQEASCDLVHSSYAAAATAASDSPLRFNPVKPTTSNLMANSVQEWQAIAPVEPKKRRSKKGKKGKKKKVGPASAPYLSNSGAPNASSWSRHPNRQQTFATDYDRGFAVSGHRRFSAKNFNEHWEDFLPGMYL